jgi:hypothetical protein
MTGFLLAAAVAASALAQVFTDPRITARFAAASLVALAVYAVHIALGMLVLLVLLPWGPDAAPGVTLAILGWIGLGALGLLRFAPRLREPPAFLLRFGPADAVCLALVAGGIGWAVGAAG